MDTLWIRSGPGNNGFSGMRSILHRRHSSEVKTRAPFVFHTQYSTLPLFHSVSNDKHHPFIPTLTLYHNTGFQSNQKRSIFIRWFFYRDIRETGTHNFPILLAYCYIFCVTVKVEYFKLDFRQGPLYWERQVLPSSNFYVSWDIFAP